MNITINTIANGGNLILYVIDSNGIKILQMNDSSTSSIMLVPGYTYRFEWHVWSPNAADYTLQATVLPATPGFPPFTPPTYYYDKAHRDMGGFYFTV